MVASCIPRTPQGGLASSPCFQKLGGGLTGFCTLLQLVVFRGLRKRFEVLTSAGKSAQAVPIHTRLKRRAWSSGILRTTTHTKNTNIYTEGVVDKDHTLHAAARTASSSCTSHHHIFDAAFVCTISVWYLPKLGQPVFYLPQARKVNASRKSRARLFATDPAADTTA